MKVPVGVKNGLKNLENTVIIEKKRKQKCLILKKRNGIIFLY